MSKTKDNNKTESAKEAPVKKAKGYKVRKDLGFKKRNYFVDNRNILLEAGKEIDKETYDLFSDHCKKAFFEG